MILIGSQVEICWRFQSGQYYYYNCDLCRHGYLFPRFILIETLIAMLILIINKYIIIKLIDQSKFTRGLVIKSFERLYTYLNPDIVCWILGVFQCWKLLDINRESTHHFGCRRNEVSPNSFGDKRNRTRRPEIQFYHLKDSNQKAQLSASLQG